MATVNAYEKILDVNDNVIVLTRFSTDYGYGDGYAANVSPFVAAGFSIKAIVDRVKVLPSGQYETLITLKNQNEIRIESIGDTRYFNVVFYRHSDGRIMYCDRSVDPYWQDNRFQDIYLVPSITNNNILGFTLIYYITPATRIYNITTNFYVGSIWNLTGRPTGSDQPGTNTAKITEFFTDFLADIVPPEYNWKAWTILQGNGGQYRERLTAIKDSSIGDDISTAHYGTQNDFIFIAPNVDMVPYARNMNYNSPVKVAWSGVNWLTMELQAEQGLLSNQVKAVFKFYAKTSSDTTPIYQETRYFFIGSTNHFYLSFVTDDTEMVGAFLPVYYTVGATGTPFSWGNASPSDSDMLLIWQWLQASGSPDPDPQPERPYDSGTTDNGGGGGTPIPQDDIHTPNVPALGAMASGMFTVYCPTDAQLQQIAAYLWSDNFIDNVKKYFNSVSDNIIAFYVLPLEPDDLQTKNFKIGNLENPNISGVKYLDDRFISVEMGSIDIMRRWGTYLDFSPFTKFSLYLPGVGVVALDSDDIMSPPNLDGYLSDEVGSTISLSYTMDLFTGTLVAYVYINGQIRYQFSGRLGYSIPLTGQNYTAMGTGFVQAMAGLATTIATGGTAAPFTAGATAAGIVNAMKPDVYRAGNLSGDASMLSLKTPMLIKTVPNVPAHEGLEDFIGGPSYKIDTINNFSGFTQAIEAHVEGISCTSAERDEIMQLLKSGVII